MKISKFVNHPQKKFNKKIIKNSSRKNCQQQQNRRINREIINLWLSPDAFDKQKVWKNSLNTHFKTIFTHRTQTHTSEWNSQAAKTILDEKQLKRIAKAHHTLRCKLNLLRWLEITNDADLCANKVLLGCFWWKFHLNELRKLFLRWTNLTRL